MKWTPGHYYDGRKAVALAGTRERLVESTTFSTEVSTVVITASEDNNGTIVVGSSTVIAAPTTRRGTPLRPLDSVTVSLTQLHFIYVDATASGDSVSWSAEAP